MTLSLYNITISSILHCADIELSDETFYHHDIQMFYNAFIRAERGIEFYEVRSPLLHFPQILIYVVNFSSPSLFLQQRYLRSEEDGKEEVTLQLLLNVSTHCGVCFPCNSSLMNSSIPLVHVVRDDTLLEVFTAFISFYFISYS